MIKNIAQALAKIGTSDAVNVLNVGKIQLENSVEEIKRIRFKTKRERSKKNFTLISLKHVNNYLKKLVENNDFATVDELLAYSDAEKLQTTDVSSDIEEYSSQAMMKKELSQVEILESSSLLDSYKFLIFSTFDIIALLLVFIGIIPGIIAFFIFFPIKIRFWRIRKLKEEKNISELSSIVRTCKSSFYGSFSTRFAILALGDLRNPEGMIAVEELAHKWDPSWKLQDEKLTRYQRIVREANQTLEHVNIILERKE